jgi:hypothetical protein
MAALLTLISSSAAPDPFVQPFTVSQAPKNSTAEKTNKNFDIKRTATTSKGGNLAHPVRKRVAVQEAGTGNSPRKSQSLLKLLIFPILWGINNLRFLTRSRNNRKLETHGHCNASEKQ